MFSMIYIKLFIYIVGCVILIKNFRSTKYQDVYHKERDINVYVVHQ